ncbi:hypothetical protein M513_07836 [Trichuris suis]|uniref:Uncharacterized protein n=1 Tax=Trichuris suis TaxID=68888 RepID=A0A085M1Z0_9BILA|nr:hypothetical protein M513_07836 [Trichuris suis]
MESRNRIDSSTRRITFATVAGDGRTEVFPAKCHRAHLIAPRQDQADGLPTTLSCRLLLVTRLLIFSLANKLASSMSTEPMCSKDATSGDPCREFAAQKHSPLKKQQSAFSQVNTIRMELPQFDFEDVDT